MQQAIVLILAIEVRFRCKPDRADRRMRFLVDAQLPLQLARLLGLAGYDVRHTLELPNGNRTADREIV